MSDKNTQQLRKTMLRLRLEMHRQEIRYETQVILQPLQKARELGTHWRQELKTGNAPIWITGGVFALTVLGMRAGRWRRWLRMVFAAFPEMRKRAPRNTSEKSAENPDQG